MPRENSYGHNEHRNLRAEGIYLYAGTCFEKGNLWESKNNQCYGSMGLFGLSELSPSFSLREKKWS
jgi:hypothetical protein